MFQSSKKKLSKANSQTATNPATVTASSSSTTTVVVTTTTPLNPALPTILQDGLPLPKLIVFDLDYTLWPFWVDTHVLSPIRSVAPNLVVTDRTGEEFRFYHQVPSILWSLSQTDVKLGVASRTHAPDLGREMLKLLHIPPPPPPQPSSSSEAFVDAGSGTNSIGKDKDKGKGKGKGKGKKEKSRKAIDFFTQMEIYPSSKLKHFEVLAKRTGILYSDMLFFDDESRNKVVADLGVTFCLVRDGTDWEEVEKGIIQWRDNQK